MFWVGGGGGRGGGGKLRVLGFRVTLGCHLWDHVVQSPLSYLYINHSHRLHQCSCSSVSDAFVSFLLTLYRFNIKSYDSIFILIAVYNLYMVSIHSSTHDSFIQYYKLDSLFKRR